MVYKFRVAAGCMIYKRKIRRNILIIFIDKGLLQKTAVIIAPCIVNRFHDILCASVDPGARDPGELMLYCYMRLHCFDTVCGKGGIFRNPLISLIDIRKPFIILPVDLSGKLSSGLIHIFPAAAWTIAHFREKGHIQKHAFKVIQGIHFCQTVLHILSVTGIVRADNTVSSGLKVAHPPILPHSLSVPCHKSPFRMRLVCPVIKDLCKIRDHGDSVLMTFLYHGSEEIKSLQTGVHPSRLRRIISQSCMRPSLHHSRLDPRILQCVHILINIDPA